MSSIEDTPLNMKNRNLAQGLSDGHLDEDVEGHAAVFDMYERKLAEKNEKLRKQSRTSLDVRLHARNVLKKTALFADWDIADVQEVIRQMHTRKFQAGTRICIQGDAHAEEFFIITEGQVRVHQKENERFENEEVADDLQEIRVLSEFDCFGLAALTSDSSGTVRSASCTAVNEVTALVLYRDAFRKTLGLVEAKKQTLQHVDEILDDRDTAKLGDHASNQDRRRRSSVGNALEVMAGIGLQAHLDEDSKRRQLAKAAVAAGNLPAPPPRDDDEFFV